jgi:hypothetical protein
MSESHPVHAAIVGAGAYAVTRNLTWSLGAGGAALGYMMIWGHKLPAALGTEPSADATPHIVLHGFQRRDYHLRVR